jgi:hypothetical protein
VSVIWFILGILFCFFSIVGVYFARRRQADQATVRKMQICPYCKHPVGPEVVVCSHCQSRLA